jgi:hypothetical protein
MTRLFARPVFIIGSPRSGTSVLTWALGQHPNILPLEETNWIGRLTIDLGSAFELGTARGERSQLSSMGVTSGDFFVSFGEAINTLILQHQARFQELCRQAARSRPQPHPEAFQISRSLHDAKERWVDGTPENSIHVAGLLKLFPQARFIHLLRDVQSVARSMLNFANLSGFNLVETEADAYRYWQRSVKACCQAEQAFGSERILRIRHCDMVVAPEKVVRQCLDFLGEAYCPDCLAPLGATINSSRVPPDYHAKGGYTAPAVKDEAEALSLRLLGEGMPRSDSNPEVARELEQEFVNRCHKASQKRLTKMRRDYRPAQAGPESAPAYGPAMFERIRAAVHRVAPCDATVIVVSRGDLDLLNLYGRRAWHFPRAENGSYAGFHPQDCEAAIAQLEVLRSRGGEFLLIPCTSFWWLDHYQDFRRHLERRHRRIWLDETCALYQLTGGASVGGEA